MKNEPLTDRDDLRDQVMAWLRANDIRPEDIAANATTTLDGDQLTTEVFMRNAKGGKQLDVALNKVATKPATYTVTVPPPPDVAAWLLPRCPTCGR